MDDTDTGGSRVTARGRTAPPNSRTPVGQTPAQARMLRQLSTREYRGGHRIHTINALLNAGLIVEIKPDRWRRRFSLTKAGKKAL